MENCQNSESATGFSWLLDTRHFTSRDQCVGSDSIATLWIIASVGLCLLYLGVALVNFSVYRRSVGAKFPRWPLCFASLFFIGCAGGHLLSALAFKWPAYRVFVVWDWFTLVVTAIGFVGVLKLSNWVTSRFGHLEHERDDAIKLALTRADENAKLAAFEARRREAAEHRLAKINLRLETELTKESMREIVDELRADLQIA